MALRRTNSGEPNLLSLAFGHGVAKRALIAALVVGTILNLINQGDILWVGGDVNLVKAALTYLVPYLVATYGAIASRRSFMEVGKTQDSPSRHGSRENGP